MPRDDATAWPAAPADLPAVGRRGSDGIDRMDRHRRLQGRDFFQSRDGTKRGASGLYYPFELSVGKTTVNLARRQRFAGLPQSSASNTALMWYADQGLEFRVRNIVAPHWKFLSQATSIPIPKVSATGLHELRGRGRRHVRGTLRVRWFWPMLASLLAITYGDLTMAAELGIKEDRAGHRSVRRAPVLMPACRQTPYAVLLGCAPAVLADPVLDADILASSRAMRAVGPGPYPTRVGR
jgi:hypothetical protein